MRDDQPLGALSTVFVGPATGLQSLSEMLKPNSEYQRRRVTVVEAEADYFSRPRGSTPNPPQRRRSRAQKKLNKQRAKTLRMPFAGSPQWLGLKALMQPGDELWEYCTPKTTWDQGMGMAGYQLMRGNEVICSILVRMN